MMSLNIFGVLSRYIIIFMIRLVLLNVLFYLYRKDSVDRYIPNRNIPVVQSKLQLFSCPLNLMFLMGGPGAFGPSGWALQSTAGPDPGRLPSPE
jgi:hypothetical protein